MVVEDDTTKGINSYTIIDNKGNTIFKNVNDYNSFANNKIAYIDVNGIYGYYSTVGIIKCTAKPHVYIEGLESG